MIQQLLSESNRKNNNYCNMELYPNMKSQHNCTRKYNINDGPPYWDDSYDDSIELLSNIDGMPGLETLKEGNNNIHFDRTDKQLLINNDNTLHNYQQNNDTGNLLQKSNSNWNKQPYININQSNSTLTAKDGGTINSIGETPIANESAYVQPTSNEFSSCNRNMNRNIPNSNGTNVIDSQINNHNNDIRKYVSHVHKYILTTI